MTERMDLTQVIEEMGRAPAPWPERADIIAALQEHQKQDEAREREHERVLESIHQVHDRSEAHCHCEYCEAYRSMLASEPEEGNK